MSRWLIIAWCYISIGYVVAMFNWKAQLGAAAAMIWAFLMGWFIRERIDTEVEQAKRRCEDESEPFELVRRK